MKQVDDKWWREGGQAWDSDTSPHNARSGAINQGASAKQKLASALTNWWLAALLQRDGQ